MSHTITKTQDLNKQVHAAGEAALKTGGVRALVASDLPESEVVGTLTKRVREAKLRTEEFDYLAVKLFGKNMVFDGVLDVNYSELHTTSTTNPYADTTIEDFNGETNKAIRKTYEAKTQSNVKTKILDSVLMNFKTNPSDAIASIFTGTENINKAQMLTWAAQVWIELQTKAVSVDVAGMEDVATTGDSVNKTIYQTLVELGKNSKTHIGVGTSPVSAPGVITSGSNSVNPTHKFKSSDFYLLTTPEFMANTRFDGEKVLYNYGQGAQEIALAGVHTLYIDDEEMPASVSSAFANVKAILVHKDAIYGIQDWEGTGIASAGKLYTVFHNYMKQDPVNIEDAPVIMFEATPVDPTKKVKPFKGFKKAK